MMMKNILMLIGSVVELVFSLGIGVERVYIG